MSYDQWPEDIREAVIFLLYEQGLLPKVVLLKNGKWS